MLHKQHDYIKFLNYAHLYTIQERKHTQRAHEHVHVWISLTSRWVCVVCVYVRVWLSIDIRIWLLIYFTSNIVDYIDTQIRSILKLYRTNFALWSKTLLPRALILVGTMFVITSLVLPFQHVEFQGNPRIGAATAFLPNVVVAKWQSLPVGVTLCVIRITWRDCCSKRKLILFLVLHGKHNAEYKPAYNQNISDRSAAIWRWNMNNTAQERIIMDFFKLRYIVEKEYSNGQEEEEFSQSFNK